MLRYNLEQRGYRIDCFENGQLFLKHVHDVEYDLMIISVQLWGENGLGLCQTIRQKGILTPILFVTTSIKEEDCSCVKNIQFLRKPFSLPELFRKVEEMVKNKRKSNFKQTGEC
ncbi:response regulator [Cohnella laeviribosi]|uniref:response regulator transcription factor n=1 Tax=Paenibacillaceae TaxID=186822 RepID=UPI0007839545